MAWSEDEVNKGIEARDKSRQKRVGDASSLNPFPSGASPTGGAMSPTNKLFDQKMANPYLNFAKGIAQHAPEILTAGSAIYNSFRGKSDYEKVVDQAFQGILADRNKFARQSSGNFTPQEIYEIRERNRSGVDAEAGNIAQRGLGTSPAGIAQITEAQQRPFLEAQATATRMLPALNQQIFNIGQQMIGDNSFQEDLGGLIQGITELRGLRKLRRQNEGQGGHMEDESGNDFDGVVGGTLSWLTKFLASILGGDGSVDFEFGGGSDAGSSSK